VRARESCVNESLASIVTGRRRVEVSTPSRARARADVSARARRFFIST